MLCRLFLLLILFLSSCYLHANEIIADEFDRTLSPHINAGFVSYNNIDRAQLNHLVSLLEQHSLPEGEEHQNNRLAFFINAYNILAIKGVVDGYGPHSLLRRYRFFKLNNYIVAGTKMNLDTLEHKIIRPLKEPRIHFALICAAVSCPPLRTEAYRANKLNDQLDDQARTFINNLEKNSIDLDKNEMQLSSIFDWFKEDFLIEANSLSEYLLPYIDDSVLKEKLMNNELSISFKKYNWSLNGVR